MARQSLMGTPFPIRVTLRNLLVIILFFGFHLAAFSAPQAIRIAITVDDLPVHGLLPESMTRVQITKRMLEVFKKHQIQEVFGFINASQAEFKNEHLKVFKMWREAGYPLGNHTYTHMDLNKVKNADYIKDIDLNEAALKKENQNLDWKFFRYPYLHEGNSLEKRDAIRKHLKNKGYKIAQVTIDFEDWSWNEPYVRCLRQKDKSSIQWLKKSYLTNANEILLRADKSTKALFKRPVKHILLLHVGAFDAEVLDELLVNYKKLGAEFITLSEAMSDEIYNLDPAMAAAQGAEFQYQVLNSRKQKLQDIGMSIYTGYPRRKLLKICL